jgi:hypothetical protein
MQKIIHQTVSPTNVAWQLWFAAVFLLVLFFAFEKWFLLMYTLCAGALFVSLLVAITSGASHKKMAEIDFEIMHSFLEK